MNKKPHSNGISVGKQSTKRVNAKSFKDFKGYIGKYTLRNKFYKDGDLRPQTFCVTGVCLYNTFQEVWGIYTIDEMLYEEKTYEVLGTSQTKLIPELRNCLESLHSLFNEYGDEIRKNTNISVQDKKLLFCKYNNLITDEIRRIGVTFRAAYLLPGGKYHRLLMKSLQEVVLQTATGKTYNPPSDIITAPCDVYLDGTSSYVDNIGLCVLQTDISEFLNNPNGFLRTRNDGAVIFKPNYRDNKMYQEFVHRNENNLIYDIQKSIQMGTTSRDVKLVPYKDTFALQYTVQLTVRIKNLEEFSKLVSYI